VKPGFSTCHSHPKPVTDLTIADLIALPYPPSDHFDGQRFLNPASFQRPHEPPRTPHRRGAILRWQLDGRPRWPTDLPRHTPTGDPHATPAHGETSVTFLGHAGFLLRIGRASLPPLTIITDPVFSERCSPFRNLGPRRVIPPGRTLAELPRIDLILISHCHYDHLDLPTLRAIARRDDPAAITPLGNTALLAEAGLTQIVERDWWDHTLFENTRITITPARHATARTPFDQNIRLWGGFMIDAPSIRLFFAGDSGHGTHWQTIHDRLGPPDLALIPIGAYEPRAIMRRVHMNPEEAVEAIAELGAKRAIGMHFGTFQLTDEPIGEPPARFTLAARNAGFAPDRCFTLGCGDTTLLPAPEES